MSQAERARELRERRQALRDSWRPRDRYVIGGVNWPGHSHEAMHRMVHEDADPAQVDGVAAEWRRHGDAIVELADRFRELLGDLESAWRGPATERAFEVLRDNARWVAELGETVSAISVPVTESAQALASARAAMPEPQAGPDGWAAVGAASATSTLFAAAAGPAGAVVGAVVGAGASVVGQAAGRWELKARAVEVMRGYELTAQAIDASAPGFGSDRPAGPWLGDRVPSGPGGGGPGGGDPGGGDPGGGDPGTPVDEDDPPTGGGSDDPGRGVTAVVPDDVTVPTWAAGPEARWQALTSATPAPTTPAPVAPTHAGVPAAAYPWQAGGNRGLGAGTTTGLPGERGGPRPSGDVRAGARGVTGPGMSGGMVPAAQREEEDREHHNRYPDEHDVFADDQVVAPPVIGG
ncbi:hypothetical protein GCM10022243_42830 [Saccharothrix violaceirubra]|uniref:PPE family protein n=1 Tax=Saccharothrix violaceirubra TaxID=413306 RepID=A0A7W7T2Z6_9PSEU|nr:hypothetical protein [Saccharothrix violaceirubra]MBB4965571.1 hypothetical protein [Saccharothrix violaceirubra]